MALKRKYNDSRLEENFDRLTENAVYKKIGNKEIEIPCTDGFTLGVPDLSQLSLKEVTELLETLEKSMCQTKVEELEQLLKMCRKGCSNEKKYARAIPATLKKFAQKKYKEIYYEMLEKVENLERTRPELFQLIKLKLDDVKAVAEVRFTT